MLKMLLFTKKWAFIAAISISMFAMSGCIESTFDLANESKLPGWFTAPPGRTRADVSVTVDYKLGPDKFTLRGKHGRKLKTVNGHTKHLRSGHFPTYPDYEVASANGITEVIKLRPFKEQENMVQNGRIVALFYVIDDPVIKDEVLTARGYK